MYSRRPAALTRPEAGIRYGRRPAALARTHAGIRYGRRLAALARPHAGAMYSRRPAALTLPHGGRLGAGIRCGMRAEHAILISCEHSLLAGEACFETKVRIRRENPCTHDMPHASIPARGARGWEGGGRGAKKEN